jgi:hypothetical protein
VAVVVSQQAAKAFLASDLAIDTADLLARLDKAIIEALVVSVAMMVHEIGIDGIAKHLRAEESDPVQGLRFQRAEKSLQY